MWVSPAAAATKFSIGERVERQLSPLQVGSRKGRTSELCALQVGVGQSTTAEAGSAQVRVAQVNPPDQREPRWPGWSRQGWPSTRLYDPVNPFMTRPRKSAPRPVKPFEGKTYYIKVSDDHHSSIEAIPGTQSG